MKVLKRFILFGLIGILAVSFMTSCSSKKDSKGQLEVKLDFGYNGVVKVASHNPLVAYIQNNGHAFSGELQMVVEDNMGGKVMIATPFEIAEHSKKEIALEVPIFIIQKQFEVRIESEKKILYEEKIKAKKVMSPNQRVIAVITDTPDAYRFLENTKMNIVNQDPYMDKMAATQVYQATDTEELEVFYFDSFDTLNSVEKLNYFNYIYMGHNQSLKISADEETVLNEWIKAGNCFIIETGADYQKINSILPSSLNPLPIDNLQNVMITHIWPEMAFDQNIDVASSNNTEKINFSYQQEGEPMIGAVTQVGYGSIFTLMINMGLEPMATWNLKAPLMAAMLQGIGVQGAVMNPGYYGGGSPYQYMLSQVPVEKKTPYIAIFIIFMVYILLIAPISYFILKKMDKRDLAWIGIPIMAILCVATLYIFGGNTRYTKAITNSVSILTADEESKLMSIKTEMNIYNNLKDNLKVEWDATESINFNYGQSDMGYMSGYYGDPNSKTPKKLTGKLLLGDPMIFEKYNAPLWSASYLTAEKTIPFTSSEKMISMKLDEAKILVKVKNTTPYTLINAFVQWGQGFIMIGDLNPGDEKEVTKDFSTFTPTPFETFVQTEMGIKPFDYAKKPTAKDMALQRKYDLLVQRYSNQYYQGTINTQNNLGNIKLCAMNNQDIGYEIRVNEDTTENYATNIIEITTVLEFEKGANIHIPAGIITPETFYYLDEELTKTGSFDFQAFDQYLRFYEQGVASFTYTLPKGVVLTAAHIEVSDVYAEQEYYNKQNGVPAHMTEGVVYSVYNVKDDVWETIGYYSDLDEKYASEDGRIQVRVDLRTQGQQLNPNDPKSGYSYAQMMKLPTISIEGSVEE